VVFCYAAGAFDFPSKKIITFPSIQQAATSNAGRKGRKIAGD